MVQYKSRQTAKKSSFRVTFRPDGYGSQPSAPGQAPTLPPNFDHCRLALARSSSDHSENWKKSSRQQSLSPRKL